MDTATEAALQAIIKVVMRTVPDAEHQLPQELYRSLEELMLGHDRQTAETLGRLANFARDCRQR